MDIRSAKKGAGTKPQKNVAEDATVTTTPALGMDGESTMGSVEKYGNIAVARYMEELKEEGIREEDILGLLDRIITDGDVFYDTTLFGRVPVRFHIRPSWLNDKILEKLDDTTKGNEKVSVMRFNNLVALYNLAASLVKYGDNTYSITTEEDFEKAVERVNALSYIVQSALVNALSVFDKAVAVATSDWAVKTFTSPRKEG